MAKRKKQQVSESPRKRVKGQSTRHHVASQEYKVKTILAERSSQYLIDWEDIDGVSFEPTWEPKDHANEQAIADWETQKAAKAAAAAPVPKRRGRPRKVIESSPAPVATSPPELERESSEVVVRQPSEALEASYDTPSPPGDVSSSEIEQRLPEIVESQPSPLFEPEAGAAVAVESPPSSFEAGDYQKFSSPRRPEESTQAVVDLTSSDHREEHTGAQPDSSTNGPSIEDATDSSKVIPDSQSAQEPSTRPAATEQPLPTATDEPGLPAQEQQPVVVTHEQEPTVEEHEQQTLQTPGPAPSSYSSFPFQTQISAIRATSLPIVSPLASIPSHSVGPFGDSAPPRPSTPSSPLSLNLPMAATQQTPNPSDSLAARLKALRERHRPDLRATETPTPASPIARLRAEEEHRRSPSAVPAVESVEPISQEEMNTSERYETLLPRAQDQTNSVVEGAKITRADAQDGKPPSARSHTVPIALVGPQRDQYTSTIYYHDDFAQRFLADSQPNDDVSAQAERFVEKMRRIAMHPDLDNAETLTQYVVEPERQAQWDIDSSSKFRFLKTFFDAIRDHSLHVVLVAPEGQVLHILDTFLTAIKVPHRRLAFATDTSISNDHAGLIVTIVGTTSGFPDEQRTLSSPADLVIALSPAAGNHDRIETLLNHDCPMLTLIVPGSVEQVDFSLSPFLAPAVRLRALVNGICQLEKEAGKLEENQLPIEAAVNEIAQYLQRVAESSDTEFPLVGVSTLRNLGSQTQSEVSSAGQKRPLELEENADVNKRARVSEIFDIDAELPMTINPREIEITHISDSVTKPTQSQPTSSNEAQLRLQQLLSEAQLQIEEHVSALSELQFRHEEQRDQLIRVTNERDAAIITAQQAVTRYTEAADSASKLKATRTMLQEQLDAANARLLKHEVPERAELEASRLAAEQARTETVKLQERLEKVQKELEYTRSLYQNTSQRASGLATQNTDLDARLKLAEGQATGEQAKLRQMSYDAQSRALRADNQQLKAQLKDRQAALKFRDEEIARLKEASRGRMGTRGSSIPRSPRLGSPMKSRQGSPAAGELKGKGGAHLHPLRNG